MKNTLWLLVGVLSLAGCEGLTGSKWDHSVIGHYSLSFTELSSSSASSCTLNFTLTGEIEIGYTEAGSGLNGEVSIRDHKKTFVSSTSGCTDAAVSGLSWKGALNGTASNLTFSSTTPLETLNWKADFKGVLNGGTITGTLTFIESGVLNGFTKSGTATTNVTLQ